MVQLALAGMSDEDDEVRSNAAFAIGMICRNTTVNLTKYVVVL
jgi:hypothetical protein